METDFVANGLATGLGLGYTPLPGTAGALIGVALALGVARLRLWQRCVAALLLIVVAIPICSSGGAHFGGDHSRIVADEMLTFPVATLALPVTAHPGLWVGTFVASRLLDGLKPPPARLAAARHGGTGIVLDDVVSNAWTLVLGLVTWHWLRRRAGLGNRR